MVSRVSFMLILFVGQLVSSDNGSEKQLKKRFTVSPFAKKVISVGIGVAVAGLSEKAAFLDEFKDEDNGEWNVCLDGFIASTQSLIRLFCSNFKMIAPWAVSEDKISFDNGKRLCSLISALHGLSAGLICHYGLKKFFPN